MKYKKQIAVSALAISLLVGGSNVLAATPQDLGIKSSTVAQPKANKDAKAKAKNTAKKTLVGTVGTISGNTFTVEVKNPKTKTMYSADVVTNASTVFTKDGAKAAFSDLAPNQKVVATGTLDKATNTLTAKMVKMVTKVAVAKTKK